LQRANDDHLDDGFEEFDGDERDVDWMGDLYGG